MTWARITELRKAHEARGGVFFKTLRQFRRTIPISWNYRGGYFFTEDESLKWRRHVTYTVWRAQEDASIAVCGYTGRFKTVKQAKAYITAMLITEGKDIYGEESTGKAGGTFANAGDSHGVLSAGEQQDLSV